jgi:hypothetical protein
MFTALLFLHSTIRWLVLASLLYSIYITSLGLLQKTAFTPEANGLRHWTATISHIQLLSWLIPVNYILKSDSESVKSDMLF